MHTFFAVIPQMWLSNIIVAKKFNGGRKFNCFTINFQFSYQPISTTYRLQLICVIGQYRPTDISVGL